MSPPYCLTPKFPFRFHFSLVQIEPQILSIFSFLTLIFHLLNLCILIDLCASISQHATLLISYMHLISSIYTELHYGLHIKTLQYMFKI